MKVYAYLRVSSLGQDEENQKLGVVQKSQQLNVTIDKYIVDKVSGVKEPDERNLGKLLRKVGEDDIIIVSELSRFGRRLFMLFNILKLLMEKGVKVYSVKDNFTLDNSIASKTLAFAFGLAAEIERDLISKRTKEALALRKQQGVHLGRQFGAKVTNRKLLPYSVKITKWWNEGRSYHWMCKKLKCENTTLKKFAVEHLGLTPRIYEYNSYTHNK